MQLQVVSPLSARQRLLLKLMSLLPNVVDVRLREEISPDEIEAGLDAEHRLLSRRCRCGKPATETSRGCVWHEEVSAHYAATLLTVLKAAEAAAPGAIVAAARGCRRRRRVGRAAVVSGRFAGLRRRARSEGVTARGTLR